MNSLDSLGSYQPNFLSHQTTLLNPARSLHATIPDCGAIRISVPVPVPVSAEHTLTVVSDPCGGNTDQRHSQTDNVETATTLRIVSVYRRPRPATTLTIVTTTASDIGGFPDAEQCAFTISSVAGFNNTAFIGNPIKAGSCSLCHGRHRSAAGRAARCRRRRRHARLRGPGAGERPAGVQAGLQGAGDDTLYRPRVAAVPFRVTLRPDRCTHESCVLTCGSFGGTPTSTSRRGIMSKAFIASVIQESINCTGVAANETAGALVAAIIREMKKEGSFTLPSFGTFTVRKTKARKALNPRTGAPVKVKAGKTVRFKASPNLKKAV